MKYKEVTAGIKLSKDYNSYSLSITADIDGEVEDAELVAKQLMAKVKDIAQKETGIDLGLAEEGSIPEDDTKDYTTKKKPVKKKAKATSDDWKHCPTCKRSCKKGFKEEEPDRFYCGFCKESFE